MKKQNGKALSIVIIAIIVLLILVGLFILKHSNNIVARGTPEHLVKELLRFANGEKVTLTCDYDLTGYDWSLTQLANNITVKSGAVLDGAGYTIIGLNVSKTNCGGLFSQITGNGTIIIKNLTLKNVNLKGTNLDGEYAGGALIGWLDSGNAINIENVKIESSNIEGYKYIGGLIGYSGLKENIFITNCQVNNSNLNSTYIEMIDGVSASRGHIGGMLGFSNGDKITSCLISNTKILGSIDENRAGSLIGSAQENSVIGDNNVLSNVTINGNSANENNVVGSVDNRIDKSVVIEFK